MRLSFTQVQFPLTREVILSGYLMPIWRLIVKFSRTRIAIPLSILLAHCFVCHFSLVYSQESSRRLTTGVDLTDYLAELAVEADDHRRFGTHAQELASLSKACEIAKSVAGEQDWRYIDAKREEAKALRRHALGDAGDRLFAIFEAECLKANDFGAQGDHKKQRASLERVAEIVGELYGDKSQEYQNVKIGHAGVAFLAGDFDTAEKELVISIARLRNTVGDNNPQVVVGLYCYASLLRARQDWKTAKPVLEQAITIRRDLKGVRSPLLSDLRRLHLEVLLGTGNLRQASDYCVRSLADEDETLFSKHHKLLRCAFRFSDHGDTQTPLALLAIVERLQDASRTQPDDRITDAVSNVHGFIAFREARYEDALTRLRDDGLHDARSAFASAERLVERARVLIALRKFVEAKKVLQRLLEAAQWGEASYKWSSMRTRADVALLLAECGELEAASELCGSISIYLDANSTQPSTLRATLYQAQAAIEEKCGRLANAEQLLTTSIEQRQTLGFVNVDIAQQCEQLANLKLQLGKRDDANQLLQSSKQIRAACAREAAAARPIILKALQELDTP